MSRIVLFVSVRLRLSPFASVCAVSVSVVLRSSPFVSVFLRFSPSVAGGVCPDRRCTAGAHINVLLLDVVRDAVVV